MWSVFSTLEGNSGSERRQKRRSGRAVLSLWAFVLLSLFSVTVFTVRVAMPGVRVFRMGERIACLSLAGVVAEEMELLLADDPETELRLLTGHITHLFSIDDTIAYVRLWDEERQLISEVTRLAPEEPRSGTNGILPDLGLADALAPVRYRVENDEWLDGVLPLQSLLIDQGLLTEMMRRVEDHAGNDDGNSDRHMGFITQQDAVILVTQSLSSDHPLLADATGEMEAVMEALTQEDRDALSRAILASTNAETAITLALEDYRASVSEVTALPEPLAELAPAPASKAAAIWPEVRGRRVLVPLLVPSLEQGTLVSAGFAEIVFYHRPADVVSAAFPADRTSFALLSLALLSLLGAAISAWALMRLRRQRRARAESVEV